MSSGVDTSPALDLDQRDKLPGIFSTHSLKSEFEQYVFLHLTDHAPAVDFDTLRTGFESHRSKPLNPAEILQIRGKWSNYKLKFGKLGILDDYDQTMKTWHINVDKTNLLHLELDFRAYFRLHWNDHMYYRPKNIIRGYCKAHDYDF